MSIKKKVKEADLQKMIDAYIGNTEMLPREEYDNLRLISKFPAEKISRMYLKSFLKYKAIFVASSSLFSKKELTQEFVLIMKEENLFHLMYRPEYNFLKNLALSYIKDQDIKYPKEEIEQAIDSFTVDNLTKLQTKLTKDGFADFVTTFKSENKDLSVALYLKKNFNMPISYKQVELTFSKIEQNKDEIIAYDLENFKAFIRNQIENGIKNPIIDNITIVKIMYLFGLEDDIEQGSFYYYLAVMLELRFPDNTMLIKEGGLPTKLTEALNIRRFSDNKRKSKYRIILESDTTYYKYHFVVIEPNARYNPIIFLGYIEDDKIYTDNSRYYPDDATEHLFSQSVLTTDETFFLIEEKIKETREEKIKIRNQKESLLMVENLATILATSNTIKMEKKISLVPVIEISYNENKNQGIIDDFPSIGAKVGHSKLYVVKSIDKFFEYIDNNEFYQYGKELVFSHEIEQFDDQSQKLIRILESKLSNNDYRYYSKGQVTLPKKRFKDLIETRNTLFITDYGYKAKNSGSIQYFKAESMEAKINLEQDKMMFNIQSDLTLNQLIIRHHAIDFVIDYKKKTYSVINYINDKQRKLAHFILDNPKFDVLHVKNELASKVVPLLKEEVIISNELKTLSYENSLLIKSYFDYDKDKDLILVKHEFSIKGEVIKELSISSAYLSLFDNYQLVLKNYGFDENKI